MKSYLSVIPALIMGLFLVIMIYSWVSIRATLQRITPKEVPTTDVATTLKDLPITDVTTAPKYPPNNEKLYRIVNNEDFSYRAPNGQLVVRKDYRILLLGTDVTRNQIQNIAKNIATENKEVNALILYFFWPGTEPTGAFTAAMATYAPNGRWADAQQSAPKTLVMEYGRTVAELTPQYGSDTGLQSAPRRKKIYWDLVKEEDRADIAGGDYEQSKRIIAKRYGLSVSEVAKIQVEGVDKRWPIPEDPRY